MTYSTGTVAVTNGSPTVTGTGTAWVDVVRPGWLIVIGGVVGVVASVTSATSITMTRNWQGATQSGAAYDALPTQGEITPFLADLQTVLAGMLGVQTGAGQGKFGDGTVGTPGIRFAADEDTGFRRKAANVLAMVAGGADRLEVTTTGAILTGLLSGTAVVQSNIDTTSGRVPTTGWMGLGSVGASPNCPDLNSVTLGSGTYNVISSTPNVASRPSGANNFATMQVLRYNATISWQIYYDRADGTVAGVRAWIRGSDAAGVWQAWRPIYMSSNILGTVSQSGGVPTGAVIERGSNANGEFVRFADGTQICRATLTSGASAAVTWTYPAAFTAAPQVSVTPRSSMPRFSGISALSSSSTAFDAWSADGTTRVAISCELIAFGRWF